MLCIACVSLLVLVTVGLLLWPHMEFRRDGKLYLLRYSFDWSDYEQNMSYHEIWNYDEQRDISVRNVQDESFLFFHVISMEYVPGDMREVDFLLEEQDFLDIVARAEITSNPRNVDIPALIRGKTAIVGNTRYLGNDYETMICYRLDGRYDELYIFYVDDLLVFQIGSPDETPKFIAFK